MQGLGCRAQGLRGASRISAEGSRGFAFGLMVLDLVKGFSNNGKGQLNH